MTELDLLSTNLVGQEVTLLFNDPPSLAAYKGKPGWIRGVSRNGICLIEVEETGELYTGDWHCFAIKRVKKVDLSGMTAKEQMNAVKKIRQRNDLPEDLA